MTRKNMYGYCLPLVCLALLSPQAQSTEQWLEEYSRDIQVKAKKKNIPGFTFAFIEKAKPASIMLYGRETKTGQAIEKDTVFRLASVSKTFTSMLIAKAVEQKQLSWNTPVAQIIPKYHFSNQQNSQLQLAHVIGQSSGYTPNAYDNLIEANYPVQRVLNMLANLKPLCEPGKCYTYQNTLFAVVDEHFKQHHSSYGQALEHSILQPLGMTQASVGKAGLEDSKKWAKPHVAISKSHWRKAKVRNDYYQYSPAAGVNASISDMVLWMRALLGEKPALISPQLVKQVTSPLTKSKKELYRRQWRRYLKDAHYGLGWRIYNFDGYQLNYHGGWVQGYRADIAFSPEFGVGYVMLMNAESNLINEFTPDFWHRYFANNPPPQTASIL